MKSPEFHVNAGVERQRVDIREERIEEIIAELIAVRGIEGPAGIKVADGGRQDPQLH
ncbi:MAG TPA: hypothetical protein VIJ38_14545 [Acidobacteriaceae bacterium]